MKKLSIISLLSILLFSSCSIAGNADYNSSLLAYFKFDENDSSLLVDSTKNIKSVEMNYHLHNSSTLSRQEVPFKEGVKDEAMVFDGYSIYGEIDSSKFTVSGNEFTISCWIAPRSYNWSDINNNSDTIIQAIASQYYRDDTFSMGFTLGYKREGQIYFGVGTNYGWVEITDVNHPLNQYEWNHVLAKFDGVNGDLSLFMNGRIINRKQIEKGSSIVRADDIPLLIGKNSVASSSGDCSKGLISGLLDELRLYNKSLSYETIKAYYESCLDENNQIKKCDFNDVWLQNSLTDDLYKPQYHGGPYEHWMNEPHAPIYYNGVYHLFYQSNPNGPYFNDAQGIVWGHLTSEDMVNWTPRKEVVVFKNGTVCPDGVWSGGSTYDKDGVPCLFFTAGNYAHPGLVSNQNVGLAYPKDLSDPYLTEWEVSDRLAISQLPGQGRSNEFRDITILKDNDQYYLVIGSGNENNSLGTALIYTTNVNKNDYFHNWDYRGHLFEYNVADIKMGNVWELPVLLPLNDENGNSTNKYVFIISPAPATTADNNVIYWIGEFDKTNCRFIPSFSNPRRMDLGQNVFTGPSGFIDPISNDAMIFSIMQSKRPSSLLSESGWSHNVGLTRKVFYDSSTSDLGIEFVDTSNIEGEVIYETRDASISTINTDLAAFDSDMYKLEMEFVPNNTRLNLNVRKSKTSDEKTIVYFDGNSLTGGVNTSLNLVNSTNTGGDYYYSPFVYKNDENKVYLTLYVDRSQIEVDFNSIKTISARSYPSDLYANGISLDGEINISYLKITRMNSIYE